ncbi:unnamed protein product [Closterium sp. Naga37s-1]|nr:unnamed protein product [Closterium sp. Naga37s-1]
MTSLAGVSAHEGQSGHDEMRQFHSSMTHPCLHHIPPCPLFTSSTTPGRDSGARGEFRRTRGNLAMMRQHAELLSSSRPSTTATADLLVPSGSSQSQLLERRAIHGNIAQMDELISHAASTKAAWCEVHERCPCPRSHSCPTPFHFTPPCPFRTLQMDELISHAASTKAALAPQRSLFASIQGRIKLLSDRFPLLRSVLGTLHRLVVLGTLHRLVVLGTLHRLVVLGTLCRCHSQEQALQHSHPYKLLLERRLLRHLKEILRLSHSRGQSSPVGLASPHRSLLSHPLFPSSPTPSSPTPSSPARSSPTRSSPARPTPARGHLAKKVAPHAHSRGSLVSP